MALESDLRRRQLLEGAAGELSNFGLTLKRIARTRSNLMLDPETLAAAAALDVAQLGEGYVESTRPRTGRTPRFIDKMPLNFFYAALIHRALPNAKIICLRRGALDACDRPIPHHGLDRSLGRCVRPEPDGSDRLGPSVRAGGGR